MKYLTLLCLVVGYAPIALTQFSLETNFNVVHIGRNQSLAVNYTHKKMTVALGAKYHFNKLVRFPQGELIKKSVHAITPAEHWGAEFSIKYQIFDRNNTFFAHLLYNGQFTRSHVRHENYFAILDSPTVPIPSSEFDYSYSKYLNHLGPFSIIENHIGLAFDVFVTDQLYLSQRFGAGILFFKSSDDQNIIISDAGNWELTEMLSLGIGYKFKKE